MNEEAYRAGSEDRVKRVRLVTVLVCQAQSSCLAACCGIDILALSPEETSDSCKKQNYEPWRHRNDPPKSYQTGHLGPHGLLSRTKESPLSKTANNGDCNKRQADPDIPDKLDRVEVAMDKRRF